MGVGRASQRSFVARGRTLQGLDVQAEKVKGLWFDCEEWEEWEPEDDYWNEARSSRLFASQKGWGHDPENSHNGNTVGENLTPGFLLLTLKRPCPASSMSPIALPIVRA